MKNKYREWINSYPGPIKNRCLEVSLEMQQEFPELTIVKGLATPILDDKKHQHAWLVDESGSIVDPTECQWLGGVLEYFDHRDEKQAKKCLNCGEWFFTNEVFCSEECRKSLDRAFNCEI